MSMPYVDIHSHLNDKAFAEDSDAVIAQMHTQGIASIVIGVDQETSQKACAMADSHEHIFACIGQHPVDKPNEQFDPLFYESLIKKHPKVVAIGECGLDFFRTPNDALQAEKKRQGELFEQQIELAVAHQLPLMIHCRDAHEETIEILTHKKRKHGSALFGNIHFFSGDKTQASTYFDLGFTISFPGVITFSSEFDDIIRTAPMSMLHAETDSPYVAPVPYRGKRNEPVYVVEMIKKIAEIRGEALEDVQNTLRENAKRVFGV